VQHVPMLLWGTHPLPPGPGMPKYASPQHQQQMMQLQKQQLKQQQAVAAAQGRPPMVGQPQMPTPPGASKIPISIHPSASVAQLQSHQFGKK